MTRGQSFILCRLCGTTRSGAPCTTSTGIRSACHARIHDSADVLTQFLVTALVTDEFRIVTASPDSPGTLCIVNYGY